MGLPVEQKRRYTITEYLERERQSLEKHEYDNGEILAMAGGSANHSLVAMNFLGELRARLKGQPCRVYESNLRVRIPRTTLYTYPDGSVICGEIKRDADDPAGETVVNPRVIVEVLSPSTELYDRVTKFSRYQQLDSLEEYVLVAQSSPHVECFWRREGGTWLLTPVYGLDAVARLQSLRIELPLREIYAGVEFPPPADVPE